jgi:hypothetical protein
MEGIIDENKLLILELSTKFKDRFGLNSFPETIQQREDLLEQCLPKFFDFATLELFGIDTFQFYNNPFYVADEQNEEKVNLLNDLINKIRESILLKPLSIGENYLYLKVQRRRN